MGPWLTAAMDSIEAAVAQDGHIEAICISAINPAIVAFDAADVLNSWGLPYWRIPRIDHNQVSDEERTEIRAARLCDEVDRRGLQSPIISDLIGYLNYNLTGVISLNTITASEMGLVGQSAWNPPGRFPVVEIGPPIAHCGIFTTSHDRGIPVSYGASDGLSAAVGAGVRDTNDLMIYLGTFGSLFRLTAPLTELLGNATPMKSPYRWLVSVPGLGPELDSWARRSFSALTEAERITAAVSEALRVPPGANGVCLLLPYWDQSKRTNGAFELVTPRATISGERFRALLESLGYLICIQQPDLVNSNLRTVVAGGGARSLSWPEALAPVLGIALHRNNLAGGAGGAAQIAALSVSRTIDNRSQEIAPLVAPEDDIQISRNRETLRTRYAERLTGQ